MTKRMTNSSLLSKWIKTNGKGALEKLALESGCSASLVQKLVAGTYASTPSLKVIDGLCEATGYEMNELFPVVENEKESA